jgi:hypothetical protein
MWSKQFCLAKCLCLAPELNFFLVRLLLRPLLQFCLALAPALIPGPAVSKTRNPNASSAVGVVAAGRDNAVDEEPGRWRRMASGGELPFAPTTTFLAQRRRLAQPSGLVGGGVWGH